ncbi:MAG: PaaI family thioesterase [Halioglobus sp.]
MTNQALIEKLNANTPTFLRLLGGRVVAVDRGEQSCTFEFNIGTDYCHSIDIVQGGFITAMLDAAMSHAVFAQNEDVVNVSSLEIKTTYLEPTRAGRLTAVGRVIKCAYKTVFMEGRLYTEDGLLTATTSSVAKLARSKVE